MLRLVTTIEGQHFIGRKIEDVWHLYKPTWGLIRMATCNSLDDIVALTDADEVMMID